MDTTDPNRVLQVGAYAALVEEAAATLDVDGSGIRVDTAESTDAGLTRLAEEAYDCVVVDGVDAVAPVVETSGRVPVLAVTEDAAGAAAAAEAGAADALVRAAGVDQTDVLATRIRNVLCARTTEIAESQTLAGDRAVDSGTAAAEHERLQTVVDALPNEVYTLDTEGNFRSIVPPSDSDLTLSGYHPDELVGEHVTTVMAEDGFETGRSAIRRLYTDEDTERVTFEADIETEHGDRVPHEIHVAPLREGDGDRITGTVGVVYDISERVERERRLREEREFIELTLDTIDDAFYLLDEHGDLVRWNEALSVVTGYSDDEIAEMNALEFFEGDDRERVADAIERTLEHGTARVEADFRRKDGTLIPFEFTGGRLTDDDGDLRGVVGIGRDIAARKEREEKLRQIRENASDVIWMTTPQKNAMTFVSEAYEEVWGRPTESLVADPNSFVDAVHPEDRERVEAALADQRRDPDGYDETYRVVQPDGDVRWVHDRASGVYDEDGELTRIVGIASDITDRKERERELELKTRAMDEAPVGITIHDATAPTAPITYANDGLTVTTGYDADDLADDWLSVLRGPETALDRVARLERAIAGREPATEVILFYRADGTPFWSRISLAPVETDDGEVTHFVGFQQDVTETKQHEQRIERRLDEFSEVLAEELQTPVERARTELERARDGNGATEAADEWLARAQTLIDDLSTVHSFSVKSRETAEAMEEDSRDAD